MDFCTSKIYQDSTILFSVRRHQLFLTHQSFIFIIIHFTRTNIYRQDFFLEDTNPISPKLHFMLSTVSAWREFTPFFHDTPWRTAQNWANGLPKAARSPERTLMFVLVVDALPGFRTYLTGPRSLGPQVFMPRFFSRKCGQNV